MRVRVIAMAMPLVLGLACKTTERTRTAQAEPATEAERSATTEQTARGHPESGTTAGATPESEAASSEAARREVREGRMTEEELKVHSDDEIISGRVAKISRRDVVIESDTGERTMLRILPETVITIEGRDALPGELREGQEVRASFNEQDGREVAVKIEAGETAESEKGWR